MEVEHDMERISEAMFSASLSIQSWLHDEVERFVIFEAQNQPGGQVNKGHIAGYSLGMIGQAVALYGAASGVPKEHFPKIARQMFVILATAAVNQGQCDCPKCQSKKANCPV